MHRLPHKASSTYYAHQKYQRHPELRSTRAWRIVGWKVSHHIKAQFVLYVLEQALYQRQPQKLIHHSGRGSQYTAISYTGRLKQAGIEPSVENMRNKFMIQDFYTLILKSDMLEKEN